MVAVVVDQQRIAVREVDVAKLLQPPFDALEAGERPLDRRIADAEFETDRHRRERILHVVPAGQVDGDRQRGRAGPPRLIARAQAVAHHVHGPQVGGLGHAIRDERPADVAHDALHVLIVGAQHRQSVERQVVQEIHVALLQAREVAVVGGEMVVVDVGDDREHRLQVHE